MKKNLIITLMAITSLAANAQTPVWINNVKVSGFGMLQYQYSSQKDSKANSFNLRMGRLAVDGKILNNFYWKAQLQFNGNTSTLGASPRVVDLFVEWQQYDFLKIKVGQFKNPFTFENPIHPIEQGFMSYSQAVTAFAGFNDRSGKHSSNGRDIGLQLQGDLFKNQDDRAILHYQVGVFNGQGINVKDLDQQKNLIGGLWVMPIKGMRLGCFGWIGSYARKGTWTNPDGTVQTGTRSLQQRRYAFSAEYLLNDWTFRSEYIHSTGGAFSKPLNNTNDEASKDCNLSTAGDQSQGVYAIVIAPIVKEKLHIKARYDMYQPSKENKQQKTIYGIGANYHFNKNLLLEIEYAYVHNKALPNPNHSIVDVQLNFRF